MKLFEAFVPRVSIKAGLSLRSGISLRPGIYTVLRSKYSSTKTLSSSSTASWTFKPTVKGTYLVRIYFAGGTRYYSDGTLAGSNSGFDYKVPHVPNDSRVVKVVVK